MNGGRRTMMKSKVFPRIDSVFPKQKMKMIQDIFKYIDRYHEIFKSPHLNYRPSFSDTDREVVFNAIGFTADEIRELMNQSEHIDNRWYGTPFYTACMLLTAWCIGKGDVQTANIVTNYMSMNIYTSLHFKYAKFNANEQIMAYTISKLNNSYDIKKLGTLIKLIEDNTKTILETYKKDLEKANDDKIKYVVDATVTRLNSKVQKIFNNYYKYQKSGEYLNMDSDSILPDDYKQLSNDYHSVVALSDKTFINFTNNLIPQDVYKFSVVGTGVSTQKFKTLIDDIRLDDSNSREVRIFIVNMISYAIYYNKMPYQYISSSKYLSIMKSGYTSNTNSKEMSDIKVQLDSWVTESANKYSRGSYGKTAANGYKKALYNFFMYLIYNEAK